MSNPSIMFYHDGRHPLIYMYEPPMQKAEYEAAVDELVGTSVEALMFCMGDGRTVLHDTQVGELWGDNVDKWDHIIFRRAHQNAKALIDSGNDPLKIVCERAHEKGMKVYPTLLMAQKTGNRENDNRGSDWRFNNTHLEIGAAADIDESFAGYRNLDFKHKEVREERIALMKETFEKYDIDGFEMQLNYMPVYFHPNEVKDGISIMNDFVGEVYHLLKSSGKNRELAIRVPGSVTGSLSIGLDVATWINEGTADVIIGQTYGNPELIDPMADFTDFVNLAKGKDCRIHAALQSHLDSDRLSEAPIEMIRATASNYWRQGIDGLYLAYWFNNWPYQASFYEKLRELPHPDIMETKDKFYSIATSTGRYAEPVLEPGLEMQLPVEMEEGSRANLEMDISDDLGLWDKTGRVHQVILRIRIEATTELDEYEFILNGNKLSEKELRKINRMYVMSAPRYRRTGYWYVFTLGKENWPAKGKNQITINMKKRDDGVIPLPKVLDVELEIKYLMGKNYHRDYVDVELGPYESKADQ